MTRNFSETFALFEDTCHQLDLKLAMHWKENPTNSSEYEEYSCMLRNLSMAKSELECLLYEEKIIQHNELLARGLLELSSTCHTHVEVPVSPNSYHIL